MHSGTVHSDLSFVVGCVCNENSVMTIFITAIFKVIYACSTR